MNNLLFKSIILLVIFTIIVSPLFLPTSSNASTPAGSAMSGIIQAIIKVIASLIKGLSSVIGTGTASQSKGYIVGVSSGRPVILTNYYKTHCLAYAEAKLGKKSSAPAANCLNTVSKAKQYGYSASKVARAGTIYVNGNHAAFVTKVSVNGTITLDETNYPAGTHKTTRQVSPAGYSGGVFIR